MIIKKYKIPVELHYYCDDCKVEVESTGIAKPVYPMKYVHRCPKCNKTFLLEQCYPCIVYEDKTIAHDILGGFNI